jgi:DNA primase
MQAARKMAEFISLIRDAVLRETVMHRVTQRLEISVQEFVKLLKAPTNKPLEDTPQSEPTAGPIVLDPTIRLLALVALRDGAAREWLLAEPWDTMLQDQPEAELLVKILEADLHPEAIESLHVFLTSLAASEESVVTGLLGEKLPAHALHIAHDCWRELERRRVRQRMDAIQARLRTPDLPFEDVAKMQNEILDLQKRLADLSRPLPPPV